MNNVLAALAELYKAAIKVDGSPLADLVSVFEGEPEKILERDCPALIIAPANTQYRHDKSGSQYDVREPRIQMTLILPRKNHYASSYGQDGNAKKVFVAAKAAEMIEATDDSQHADVHSVVGVVQNNQTLPYSGGRAASMALIESVEYNTPPPSERGFSSYEATVDAIVTLRGNRA